MGGMQASVSSDQLFPPAFIDFAKAVVRHHGGRGYSRGRQQRLLQMLRMIECALRSEGHGGDPTCISLHTLHLAAQIGSSTYRESTAYGVGRSLEFLSKVLEREGMTRYSVASFSNPVPQPDHLHIKLGREGDRCRQAKLPDERALECVGRVFAGLGDANRPGYLKDLFTTSCLTILLAGSKRGGELFEMRVDSLFAERDSDGEERWGFRWRNFKALREKNRISWIHQTMAPYAREAFNRIRDLTEEPRQFARYCEEQQALQAQDQRDPRLKFYRHSKCPVVPADQPLSLGEVAQAIGVRSLKSKSLAEKGLVNRSNYYTLDTLWRWVLSTLPVGFPYVATAKDSTLTYKDALFCMHPRMVTSSVNKRVSPVSLLVPTLETLMADLRGRNTDSFFVRHRATDNSGRPLRLATHQIRHLLDTFAHKGTGDNFLDLAFVNAFAGRDMAWQGRTYDHSSPEDKAEIVRAATQQGDDSNALLGLSESVESAEAEAPVEMHWSITLRPRNIGSDDLHHRSATIATLWGGCEHDWLLKPCPYHRDCLNCVSHVCIKSSPSEDKERLDRLSVLLDKLCQQEKIARKASDRGEPGAKAWLEYQVKYKERVEELITLLASESVSEGAIIRLSQPTGNTHLHRVLQRKVRDVVDNRLKPSAALNSLVNAFRENRAVLSDSEDRQLEPVDGS